MQPEAKGYKDPIKAKFEVSEGLLFVAGRCPGCNGKFKFEKKRRAMLNTYEVRCICGQKFIVIRKVN